MGWWKVQGTEHLIGDEPLDALGGAVAQAVSHYQSAFGRRPTSREWEAILVAVLGSEEADGRVTDDGIVMGVQLTTIPK